MSFKNRLLEIHWTLAQRWFGVWEVRNYYTTLERRAKAGAEITFGYVLMVLTSATLATSGLLLDNPAVVIGSMCVAPFLGPSRAVCIGGLFRNRKVFLGGLLKQLFGLLIVGAGLAYIITSLLRVSAQDLSLTGEILLRAMSTPKDVVLSIMIAVAAGAAASLSLAADPRIVETPWGQVIDAVIGVEIAISLIPPASVVGIGLAFGRPDISRNALLLLLVNVLGLDILGSTLMLALRGVRAKFLVQEKAIRQAVEATLAASTGVTPLGSSINVTLVSADAADIDVSARNPTGEVAPASLAEDIAAEVLQRTRCRSEVTVEIVPSVTYSTL